MGSIVFLTDTSKNPIHSFLNISVCLSSTISSSHNLILREKEQAYCELASMMNSLVVSMWNWQKLQL